MSINKNEYSKYDTWQTDCPICPVCGEANDPPEESDGFCQDEDDTFMTCDSCGKTFRVWLNKQPTYTTVHPKNDLESAKMLCERFERFVAKEGTSTDYPLLAKHRSIVNNLEDAVKEIEE